MEPNTEAMSEALDMIHDITLKLMLEDGLSPLLEDGLEKIHALARYKTDTLAPDDKKRLGIEVK